MSIFRLEAIDGSATTYGGTAEVKLSGMLPNGRIVEVRGDVPISSAGVVLPGGGFVEGLMELAGWAFMFLVPIVLIILICSLTAPTRVAAQAQTAAQAMAAQQEQEWLPAGDYMQALAAVQAKQRAAQAKAAQQAQEHWWDYL